MTHSEFAELRQPRSKYDLLVLFGAVCAISIILGFLMTMAWSALADRFGAG